MSSVALGAFLGTRAFRAKSQPVVRLHLELQENLHRKKTDACGGGTMTFGNFFIDEVSLMTQEKIVDVRCTYDYIK